MVDQTPIDAIVISHPSRFSYGYWSLRDQCINIWLDKSNFDNNPGHKSHAQQIVEAWQDHFPEIRVDYVVLTLGDYEVPSTFTERGLQSGADIYGVPMLHQKRQNRIFTGLHVDPTKGYKEWPDFDDVYPDSPILVRTELAKEWNWTTKTAQDGIDYLNPFMVWADKVKKAKIVIDHGLVGIHHDS